MNGKLPEVDATAVFGPVDGVAWVPVGDEIVVYRVHDAASLVLNSTAGLLWQCLDGTSPLSEILDDLSEAFGADPAQVRGDCLPLLRTWLAERLVEEVNRG